MSEFLRELGYNPLRYWLLAGSTFVLWFASTVVLWKQGSRSVLRLNRPIVFGGLLLLTMFAWRWPALFFYKPVNPDEAQFLAAALTTLARGSLWWTDATTSGPLVVLPLTLPGLAGFPVDFIHGRLIALLLEWGTVFLGYLMLRHVHGDQKGRLLVLPLACFIIFLSFWDFVPYCSELSPLFMSATAAWLGVTAFQPDGLVRSRGRLAASGLILGLIPFSKFQVLPLGAAIGFSTVIWILRQPAAKREAVVRDLLCLIGSTIGGFGLMLASLGLSGEWTHFYNSYVVHNLYYTQARGMPWSSSGYVLSYLTEISWGFSSFHYGALLLLILSFFGVRRAAWRPMMLGWVLVAAGYCAVLVPGRLYPHYLLFLSLPLSLLVGLQFGYLLETPSRFQRVTFIALFLCIGMGTQLVDRLWERESLHKLIPVANARQRVAGYINHTKQSGDALAVWGWRPELYVETQLPQASRESLTEAQLGDHPQREYYRARFLSDLRANRPAFFVDSIGDDDYLMKDRARQGHESFPELANYIRQEYESVGSDGSFRVYLRRDRRAAAPSVP